MKQNLSFTALMIGFAVFWGISSCVKRVFDEPPIADEVAGLEANTTIAAIKSRFTGSPVRIDDDAILRGIVIADDRSGNFFKIIVIQDETAGIEIPIDRIALHDDYPIGREVFVKCQGLWLCNNNGVLQLGAAFDQNNRAVRIPDNLRGRYLFRGKRNQPVNTLTLRINELRPEHISRLIKIEGVQFNSGDLGKTLAIAATQTSQNLNLEDCSGNRILIRTSGFAQFANTIVPNGRGEITAVYSVFGNDQQLFIREIEDLAFVQERCGTSGGSDLTLVSIASVRALYQGQTTSAPDKSKIKGTIISDRIASNITSRNCVVQEPDGAGIVVRFLSSNTFALGDEVEIDISNLEISEFQGLLQINNVPNSNARKVGEGSLPTPKVLTIAELLADFENYESQLVRIANVRISKSQGNTFSGTSILNDGTGSIDLFTQSYASFASNVIPGGVVTLTGIVTQGGNQSARQISLRNLNDIEGGNNSGPDLNETFSNVVNNTDLNLPGWSNIAEIGSRVWRGQVFSGNGYAQATSFNSPDPVNVMWLITPPITLDQAKTLSFETAMNFWRHDALEVLVSSNFSGNVASANWTKLNARLATESDPVNTFIPSGDIDLSGFSGTIHIAFKYSGDNTNNTSTYRVDNVVVKNK